MISIPDELKVMIDDYNENHRFKKLHVSEICQEAIYNAIIGSGDCCKNSVSRELKKEPVSNEPVSKEPASNKKQVFKDDSEKPVNSELKIRPAVDKQVIKDDSEKPVIPCPICGKEFEQTKPTRKYCSKNCATTASKRRTKASL